IAVGVFQIDDDHVGIELAGAPGKAVHLVDDGDAIVSGIAQALLDDGRADPVLVDDQYVQSARLHGVAVAFSLPGVGLALTCGMAAAKSSRSMRAPRDDASPRARRGAEPA